MPRTLALCLCLTLATSVWGQTQTDLNVFNFALNLEYLEANFYSCAAFGTPISSALTGGGPTPTGCVKANLSPKALAFATAVAKDEIAHVTLLRSVLGSNAVAQPQLDIGPAFVAAANALGFGTLSPSFNAYASDLLFYHASYIFEDLGVTAYLGAAPLISAKYLPTAGGIMNVEAYHGGAVRSLLLSRSKEYVFPYGAPVSTIVNAISALRSKASGATVDGPLVTASGMYVVAPSDANAIAFARNTTQVLAVATLGGAGNKGGFYPNGLNGNIK